MMNRLTALLSTFLSISSDPAAAPFRPHAGASAAAATAPAADIKSAAADTKSRASEASSAAADVKSALSTIRGSSDSTPTLLDPADVKQGAADMRAISTTPQTATKTADVPFGETKMQNLLGDMTRMPKELQRIVGDYLASAYVLQEVLRGHTSYVSGLALLSDGRIVSRGLEDKTMRVWDLGRSGADKCEQVFRVTQGLLCFASLPTRDGRIVASFVHAIRVLDFRKPGRCIIEMTLEEHDIARRAYEYMVQGLATFSDGRIVSGSLNGILRIWNLERPGIDKREMALQGYVGGGADSPATFLDGRIVSAGTTSNDPVIRIWNPEIRGPNKLEIELKSHVRNPNLVTLPCERIVSGGCDSNVIRVFNLRIPGPNKLEMELKGAEDGVRSLAALPDGRIVSGSMNGVIRIWNLEKPGTDKCEMVLEGHQDTVLDLQIFPDGTIVSGSADKTIRVWESQKQQLMRKHLDQTKNKEAQK